MRDARGLGVMFAPQLRYFTCLAGPKEAIQQRTSLPELTALFQVRTQSAVSRVRQGHVCWKGCAHGVVSMGAAATHAWACGICVTPRTVRLAVVGAACRFLGPMLP